MSIAKLLTNWMSFNLFLHKHTARGRWCERTGTCRILVAFSLYSVSSWRAASAWPLHDLSWALSSVHRPERIKCDRSNTRKYEYYMGYIL